ncbi:hypothetical protein [Shouchella lonarensis]|uniref:Uncharacterized protein n=1 Tax=Shouchella lonarensis TaxID=1464122 RepID=A0A1G6KQI2_9BACI|nr:hypothetical protein [Shouchella lonarensis]SDC33167.1 hypothetical protein SAMN05421737_107113 [Shouchella lonarensis]
MEWTFIILIAVSAILLAMSYFKAEKSPRAEEAIEQLSISFMEEIHHLKSHIRDLELDVEIAAQESGRYVRAPEEQATLRTVLDLHKRGYSAESISAESGLEESEVTRLLAPFIEAAASRVKVGRS